MNWLVILIFILFILTVVQGYKVGFIKMVFSILAFLLSMILVFVMTPYTTQFIKEYTPIYSLVEEQCVELLNQSQTETTNSADSQGSSLAVAKTTALSLPKMAQAVMSGDSSQLEGVIAKTGVYNYFSGYMADIIIGIIAFFITLAIINVFLKIMFHSLEKVTDLPGVNQLNKIAGLVAGIGKGIVSIWIFYLILFITAGTQFGSRGIQLIQANPLLNLLYEKNLILQLILSKLGS